MVRTRRCWHRQLLIALLFSAELLVLPASTAFAHANHAKVISATPSIGSTIATAPTTVTVVCAENLTAGVVLQKL